MKKPSTTFLFDIGNVIIKFDFLKAVAKVAPQCKTPADEILLQLQPITDRFECGEYDVPEFVSLASEKIGYSGTQAAFIHAFEDIFELNPPIADLISELAQKEYRLCLLSNTNAIHVPYFTNKWQDVFIGNFDQAVYSHDVGVMKPAPEIFDLAIDLMNLDPANTIYIDDRADNCETGAAAGLQSFCYDYNKHDELIGYIRQTNPIGS